MYMKNNIWYNFYGALKNLKFSSVVQLAWDFDIQPINKDNNEPHALNK